MEANFLDLNYLPPIARSRSRQGVAESFNGDSSGAPLLHVEFSVVLEFEPPSIPTGLSVSPDSSSRVFLAWSASTDNVQVSGYEIYRCTGSGCEPSALVGSTSGTSYTDLNLIANTPYTYAVVARDISGNVSDVSLPASATTLAPGQVVFYTLVGAGDIATSGSPTGGAESTAQLIDDIVLNDPETTVFTAGDNAYQLATTADFLEKYDPTWGRHRSRTFPSPGNHDYNVPGAADYLNYFCPASNDCVFPANAHQVYYSYDLGSWHIISLDSELNFEAGSAQVEWLKQDLATVPPESCIFAYWHIPYYSSNGSSSRSAEFWKALELAGADIVVAGHRHIYERFAKQDSNGNLDPNGIRAFVVGTGGATLRTISSPIPNSEVLYNDSHGIIKFTLRDSGYDWEFIPKAGQTFTDTGSDTCNN